ncbi:MAG: hypothetical protein RLZZ387_3577 [Chloroflexota bacterium]|jgi:hypothetical protein
MSDPKAERLAAIRAANAERRLAAATGPSVPEATPADSATGHTLIGAANAAPALPIGANHTSEAPPLHGRTPAPRVTASSADLDQEPALGVGTVGLIALSAAGGALLAVTLPSLLPGLAASLLGPEPKAYWYLSRSTAFVAYALLWLAMALGLMMTNRLARLWPGGPLAFDLHEHASILGLAFGLFHALILLGDRYASYSLAQILVPFASGGALAGWVGLGQVGLYLMGVVGLSFYVRPLIGWAGWRLIHFLSFATFGLALLHGVMTGSDTGSPLAQAIYWLSGGSLLFLTVYRVLTSVVKQAPAEAASTGAHQDTQTIQA